MTDLTLDPAPATEIAVDIARRSLWFIPGVLAFGSFWGVHGVVSASYGLLIVIVNFLLAALALSITGRISFVAMAGAALFGYLIRMGIIFAAVVPVLETGWMEVMPLGITLIVTHLALLVFELRHVSGSYAYPGLKPTSVRSNAGTESPSIERPASAA